MVTSTRTSSRSCWAAAVAVSLFATLAAAAPVGAAQPDRCTGPERRERLRVERDEVLSLLGHGQIAPQLDHTILENEAELASLGVPNAATQTAYNFLDHLFASARGIGIGIVDTLEPLNGLAVEPGAPDVLFYAPDPQAEDVIDPNGPDFPYRLVGWAYAQMYVPGQHPEELDGIDGRCMTRSDWFVHERSIHPFDTWQNIAVPPPDDVPKGSNPGQQEIASDECDPSPCPPGIQHGRLWDIHFWLADDGDPRDDDLAVSILNRRAEIPGWDPDVGVSFFFPARA